MLGGEAGKGGNIPDQTRQRELHKQRHRGTNNMTCRLRCWREKGYELKRKESDHIISSLDFIL